MPLSRLPAGCYSSRNLCRPRWSWGGSFLFLVCLCTFAVNTMTTAFIIFFIFLFIYLAVLGLSCCTQYLWSLLRHGESSAEACKLSCGIVFIMMRKFYFIQRMLDFANAFPASVICFFLLILLMYYINRFSCVEPSVHSRGKSYLFMVCALWFF